MSEKWEIGQEIVTPDGGKDRWRADYGLQSNWELSGWRAAVSAPPVERALTAGWRRSDGIYCYDRRCSGDTLSPGFFNGSDSRGACAEHAESMGVFASPEPKAEAAKSCADWCGTINGCGGSNWCRAVGLDEMCRCTSPTCRGIATATPAPVVEKPRPLACSQNGCGDTDRVQVRYVFKRSPKPMCQACYLECERGIAEAENAVGDPKPRPAAHPGISPVVFGLSVGILGARGMRSGR